MEFLTGDFILNPGERRTFSIQVKFVSKKNPRFAAALIGQLLIRSDALRAGIIVADLPAGKCFPLPGKLPSMSSLVEEDKVNLQTANRAVKVLEQKGVLKCHVGKGGTRIDAARAHLISSTSQSHFSVDQALSGRPKVRLRFLIAVVELVRAENIPRI